MRADLPLLLVRQWTEGYGLLVDDGMEVPWIGPTDLIARNYPDELGFNRFLRSKQAQ